jgi:hypothetical protein
MTVPEQELDSMAPESSWTYHPVSEGDHVAEERIA